MTSDKSKFMKLDTNFHGQVTFRDDSKVEIKGKGEILIQMKYGTHKMILNVYYIPQLRSNTLSLGQLLEESHCKVYMKDHYL